MPNPTTGRPIIQPSIPNIDDPNRATVPQDKFARRLAKEHQATITGQNPPMWLLDRLPDLETLLQTIHQYFFWAAEERLTNATAAEWLLDNNYVVQQAVKQVYESLPPTYYKELPKLDNNKDTYGFPRIYVISFIAVVCTIPAKVNG